MNILSIDPGSKYTGIAMYFGDKDVYQTLELYNYNQVWQFVSRNIWDYVVCEDFTAEHISHYGITTVRIVGGVEAICMLENIPMNRPRAQDRIPFIPTANELLLKIHDGKMPPRDHQQSALAHLLCFQQNTLGRKVR